MLSVLSTMIKRIIDISEAAFLHVKHQQLLIDKKGETVGQVPIEDLGVLILQHPAIVLTQQVVVTCQKNKVVIIFCDEKHLPYSVILPIAEGHRLHNKILKQQVSISEPTRKRLWKHIVIQKITQQAKTLQRLNKNPTRLEYLSTKVKSGDSTNCEAVAAQAYWKLLFGAKFKRHVETNNINHILNYGYAIIRASIARSICAAGLHPTIGLFHTNQYNPLCLADDLMEPFRPWVDYTVYKMVELGITEINKESKIALLDLLTEGVYFEGNKMPFMISLHYLMANLKRCYNGEIKQLIFPEIMIKEIV